MPTLPPLTPEISASGIVVDPNTNRRVVPVSKRPDGRFVPVFCRNWAFALEGTDG
jgi:hypothetical protein